jgi:hypothetical protein
MTTTAHLSGALLLCAYTCGHRPRRQVLSFHFATGYRLRARAKRSAAVGVLDAGMTARSILAARCSPSPSPPRRRGRRLRRLGPLRPRPRGAGRQDRAPVKAAHSGILYAATTAGVFSSPSASGACSPVGERPGERKLNMGGIPVHHVQRPQRRRHDGEQRDGVSERPREVASSLRVGRRTCIYEAELGPVDESVPRDIAQWHPPLHLAAVDS